MKVVLVSSGLASSLGGSALSEAQLGGQLAGLVDLVVLCPAERCEETFWRRYGVREVHRYRRADVAAALLGRHPLAQLLDGAHVGHLNGHWRWELRLWAELFRRRRVPFVLHPRGMLLVGHRKVPLKRLYNRMLGNAIVRGASRVIALSRFETRHFVPYGLAPERVTILPNGIDRPPADPGARRFPGRYFLYLGRLESRKNLPFLLEGFRRYREGDGGNRGTAELLVVGPAEKGHEHELTRQVAALRLEGLVHFPPPAYGVDKWAYLRDALAVLYPSREEPFGRVPFEAVAAGSLPIVPDASGGAEYLARFLPEAVYAEGEVGSLVAAMRRAETDPPDEAIRRAQAWVFDELSWDRVAARVLSLYEEVAREASNLTLPQLPEAHRVGK